MSDAFAFLKALVAVSGRRVEIETGPCTTPFDRQVIHTKNDHGGTLFDNTHEGVQRAIGYYTRCRVQEGFYNYPIRDPYHKGRMDAFVAIRASIADGRWTAKVRKAWLRAAMRLREVNRCKSEGAYYTGWISVLKSHLSAHFSSMSHEDVSLFIVPLRSHHNLCIFSDMQSIFELPLSVQEIAGVVECSSLSIAILCGLVLLWLSPLMALHLWIYIAVAVHFLYPNEQPSKRILSNGIRCQSSHLNKVETFLKLRERRNIHEQ